MENAYAPPARHWDNLQDAEVSFPTVVDCRFIRPKGEERSAGHVGGIDGDLAAHVSSAQCRTKNYSVKKYGELFV